MIQISHECPINLLERSRQFNDYDYALVHLFEKYPDYYKYFEDSLELGREVILDNSLFELGQSFNPSEYVKWVRKLKPTWFILPDIRNNGSATVDAFLDFLDLYEDTIDWNKSKAIGVVHGKTASEMLECYIGLDGIKRCSKISFPVYSDAYLSRAKDMEIEGSKYYRMMMGRWCVISDIMESVDKENRKPHHILGVSLPQEISFYGRSEFFNKDTDSCDTSNPVLHGLEGILYGENGLNHKSGTMMCDIMEIEEKNIGDILYNVYEFRKYADPVSPVSLRNLEKGTEDITRFILNKKQDLTI